MNKVILMGRLAKDPVIRYPSSGQQGATGRYTLAVNRSYKREGEPDADFINCIAFGTRAEFAGKYFKKGMMVAVVGELRISSYTDRNGERKYSTDIIISEQHFAESRSSSEARQDADRRRDFAPSQDPVPEQWERGQQQSIDDDLRDEGDLPF